MGFLSCLGFRGRSTRRPATRRPATRKEQDTTPAQSPPATPWTAHRDEYGRPYWYNSKTKQGTYSSTPYGNVGFLVAVPPQQCWPMSPHPARFHHSAPWSGLVPASPMVVFPPPPPPPPPEEKKEEKSDKKERWKEVFSEDGEKYWIHTGTKKTTDKDPYV